MQRQPEPDMVFVTYKWLIVTTLSSFAILVTVIGILSGVITAALASKVNQELYTSQYRNLCTDLDEIKLSVCNNAKLLEKFNQNQLLVLRALKIEPVR